MGTQDAIAILANFVANKLEKYEDGSAIFLDVAKVFHSINHAALLRKLCIYGFRRVAHQWSNYIIIRNILMLTVLSLNFDY